MTYNQVQSFQFNDYVKNCKQQCVHVYIIRIYVYMCMCVLLHELLYQEFMLAITQLSHFSDLAIITACILHGNSMVFDMSCLIKSFY